MTLATSVTHEKWPWLKPVSEHDDPTDGTGIFNCDLCDKTWDRSEMTFVVLRTMVGVHLWVEHGIHSSTPEYGDSLPMTKAEVAWVRAQRRP